MQNNLHSGLTSICFRRRDVAHLFMTIYGYALALLGEIGTAGQVQLH